MKRGNTMPVLINCAICRKPVATPKTLTCMHQFCSKCLAKPSAWGGNSGVACPKCGIFTEQKDIRCESLPPLTKTPEPPRTPTGNGRSNSENRKSKRNSIPEVGTSPTPPDIENVAKSPRQQSSTATIRKSKKCQICDEGKIVYKCITCELFMCAHCQKSHKRIPVTADHVIQDIKSIANEQLLSLKEDMARHTSYNDEAQDRLDLYEMYKSYLQTLQTDITGEIDKAALAAKTKLEKRIDREAAMNKAMVDKAITKELKTLELGRISLSDQLAQSKQTTSSLMNAITQSRDNNNDLDLITNGQGHVSTKTSGDEDANDATSPINQLIQLLARDQLKTKLEIMVVPRDFEDDPPDVRINLCDVDISRGDIKLLYPPNVSIDMSLNGGGSENGGGDTERSENGVRSERGTPRGVSSKPPVMPQSQKGKVPGKAKKGSLLPLRVKTQKTPQPVLATRNDTPIPDIDDKSEESDVDKSKIDQSKDGQPENDKSENDESVNDQPENIESGSETSENEESTQENNQPGRIYSKSLKGITRLKWSAKEQISIPDSCDTFIVIKNKFWCVSRMKHTITIADTSGKILNTISDSNMKYPTAVTACGNNSVMVACTSGFGLLVINQTGNIKQVVANGSFNDVSYSNGTITAIESEPCRIVTFRQSPDREQSWVCQNEIELDFMTGSQNDNAIYSNEQFFVSSIKNKCVFIYGDNGEVLNTYRAFLPGGLGAWHLCRLAMVDKSGSMLIVDQSSYKILVLDKDNQGENLAIDKGRKIIDVVIDEHDFMFVLDTVGFITRYQSDLPVPLSGK